MSIDNLLRIEITLSNIYYRLLMLEIYGEVESGEYTTNLKMLLNMGRNIAFVVLGLGCVFHLANQSAGAHTGIVMVLIFVIGHAINIFMNVLGAMVHPMRLTFVEFFKNSGYEGGGKEYKPFRNLE